MQARLRGETVTDERLACSDAQIVERRIAKKLSWVEAEDIQQLADMLLSDVTFHEGRHCVEASASLEDAAQRGRHAALLVFHIIVGSTVRRALLLLLHYVILIRFRT